MPYYKRFLAKKPNQKRIYLDYASSTPRDEKMIKTVPKIPVGILAANPSALHKEGVALRKVIEGARARVAEALEVHPDEIIFTSGATESDNLAIAGVIHSFLKQGIKQNEIMIFSSELEHAAVAETISSFTTWGIQHTTLSTPGGIVDPKNIVVPKEVKVVIVSVMYVSNEIGTVQPIVEIAKRIRKLRKDYPEVQFVFHTDATQAPLHFSLRVPTLGVDMMTLGATKLYCQKGVGVLYKKRNIELSSIVHGGGQEFGLRPGTEPSQLIHEFSYALEYAQKTKEKETPRITELQKYFESEIEKNFPQIRITAKDQSRTSHITHLIVPNFDSELLVLELDARGIAVSAKSACKNEDRDPRSSNTLRFSFGRMTTKKDLDKAISALISIFQKYHYLQS